MYIQMQVFKRKSVFEIQIIFYLKLTTTDFPDHYLTINNQILNELTC